MTNQVLLKKKKSVLLSFCGVVIELLVLFSVWRFCCGSGALFEGGKWEERLEGEVGGDCVTTRFLVVFYN